MQANNHDRLQANYHDRLPANNHDCLPANIVIRTGQSFLLSPDFSKFSKEHLCRLIETVSLKKIEKALKKCGAAKPKTRLCQHGVAVNLLCGHCLERNLKAAHRRGSNT